LLGADHPLLRTPPQIAQARMFVDAQCLNFQLPSPAWSIARRELDHALWQAALQAGVDARDSTVVEAISGNSIQLDGQSVAAAAVIDASGRWSNLRRKPRQTGARWIGIKAHFAGEQAPPSTDIYFFTGGYCGVQPLSHARVNASAMVRADVATSLAEVFAAHPALWLRSRAWEQVSETVATSPLIHATPEPVTNGVYHAGDAAAFIDPFTGDGISLALRSGALAAECAMASDPAGYAREYKSRFARAFHAAAFSRWLSRAPVGVRRLAGIAFRSHAVRDWALELTRGT
jgi:flavin-dependent dehydrogenase